MPYDGTYSPGDQDYDNYNYYGNMPMQFPNSGWGGPRSPAFQQAAPMPQPRDYMSRDNGNVGNSAFAPFGGINFGNPMMNMLGMMAMQMAGPKFGMDIRNLAPMLAPDMDPMSYFASKARFQNSYDPITRGQLYASDQPFLDAALGKLGPNAISAQSWDMFNPAGSNAQAYESIYGRMGVNFGGNLKNQSNKSIQALNQFNDRFLKNEGLDFKGTYGYDRNQSMEAYDAATRYGIGGLSGEKFAESVDKKSFGTSVGRNNSVFSAASEIFGKDKGFDELAQLMTKSLDGFQGLDSNKATDLLLKIQSASKAVNISSKAFMEYSSMFGQLYAAHGMGGITTANQLMDTAMGASIATNIGRKTGDVLLMDQNKNMEATALNRLDQLGSPVGRKALVLAARYANMSADVAASMQLGPGLGTMQEFMKKGGKFQQLYNDSNPAGLESALASIDERMNGALSLGANNLSDYDRRDAASVMDIDHPGGWNANKLNEALARTITANTGLKSDQVKALLGQISSIGEGGSEKAIEKLLRAANPNISKKDLGDIATKFSGEYRTWTNDPDYLLSNAGFSSINQASAAIAANSPEGQRQAAAKKLVEDDDLKARKNFHAIAGDLLRGKGAKDWAKPLLDGSIAIDKFYRHDKDGNRKEFDLEYAKKVGMKATKSVFMSDQMASAVAMMDDANKNGKIDAAAEAAKKYILDQYGGEENADEAARDKAYEASDKIRREGFKGVVDKFNKASAADREAHKNDLKEGKEERNEKLGDSILEYLIKIYVTLSGGDGTPNDDDPTADAPGKPNS